MGKRTSFDLWRQYGQLAATFVAAPDMQAEMLADEQVDKELLAYALATLVGSLVTAQGDDIGEAMSTVIDALDVPA